MTLTLPPGTRLGKPGEVIAHGTADPPPGESVEQHVAGLRRLAANGTPAQKKAAAAVLARMGSGHAHANTWADLGAVIELGQMRTGAGNPPPASSAKSSNATAQARVGAGSPAGGQFAASGSSGSKTAKPAPKGKTPAKPAPKGKPALTGVAAQKATLLGRAKADRAQAAALTVKIVAAKAQEAKLAKSSAASSASNASATSSTGQTASTSNVTASSAPAASTGTASTASTPAVTTASLAKQITGWQAQVKTLLGQAAAATAQAAKL